MYRKYCNELFIRAKEPNLFVARVCFSRRSGGPRRTRCPSPKTRTRGHFPLPPREGRQAGLDNSRHDPSAPGSSRGCCAGRHLGVRAGAGLRPAERGVAAGGEGGTEEIQAVEKTRAANEPLEEVRRGGNVKMTTKAVDVAAEENSRIDSSRDGYRGTKYVRDAPSAWVPRNRIPGKRWRREQEGATKTRFPPWLAEVPATTTPPALFEAGARSGGPPPPPGSRARQKASRGGHGAATAPQARAPPCHAARRAGAGAGYRAVGVARRLGRRDGGRPCGKATCLAFDFILATEARGECRM
ncbi:Protein of unknown function [Gryllus bimaculatus]|nr:Protein of unknown function [Gryllus bimaculatus]